MELELIYYKDKTPSALLRLVADRMEAGEAPYQLVCLNIRDYGRNYQYSTTARTVAHEAVQKHINHAPTYHSYIRTLTRNHRKYFFNPYYHKWMQFMRIKMCRFLADKLEATNHG